MQVNSQLQHQPKTRIARILQERGLTQKQFSELIKKKTGCEITNCNISRHVNGKKAYMSTETLMIFAITLDVSADSLLEWPARYGR
jgi:transcriptional regulator with XRE-family HTH domain